MKMHSYQMLEFLYNTNILLCPFHLRIWEVWFDPDSNSSSVPFTSVFERFDLTQTPAH